MYAVVNHLHFNKPADDIIEAMRDEGMPLLASHAGFKDLLVVREAEDRVAVIILWEDETSAVEGARSFGPAWFAPNLKPYLTGPEGRSVGAVVVHHAGA